MLEKAKRIAMEAGNILVDKLNSDFTITQKGSIDLVTDADLASEKYIVEALQKVFPEHGIYAEEGRRASSEGDLIWFVDPLDGTTNFAHRVPYFSVSLALIKGKEILLGVVYNPLSGECYTAERGKGAFLNGEKITISKTASLQKSLLVTGFSYSITTDTNDNMKTFEKVTKASQGVRRMGSAALDLCYVACGRFDAFWERRLQTYDMAAGALVVLEAGGQLTNCSGEPYDVLGNEIYASNGLIHEELLQILKG